MKETELLDTVRLLKDITGTSILAGTVGTVVDQLSKKVVLVEFIGEDYDDIETHCLSIDDIEIDRPYSEMVSSSAKPITAPVEPKVLVGARP